MDFLQKLEQKNLEIDQKKQIIAKLARQNARLKDEILMSQEKIGQIDERIENHNHELTYRRQRLKELAAENPKLEEQAVKQVKAEEGINYKNIEKDIRQKVYNIISQREGAEVDPTELFFFEGQKLEVKPNTIINTVKVKYISLMLPSEEERGMKTVPKEATFRISKSTTLNQLRTQACDYWNLNPEVCSLRLQNFTTVDKILDQPIDSYFMKNTIFPELWLTENDPRISKYTNKPDQYIDDPSLAAKAEEGRPNLDEVARAKQEKEKSMNILENYRGLKYYAPFRQESAEDIENRRLHGRDTSCCTLLFLILLLSLTIFVISERRDVNTEFWLQEGVRRYTTSINRDGISFWDINTQLQITYWILDVVGKTFFLSSEDSSQTGLLKQLETVGPLMIRTVRTQEKKCLRADDFDVRNYTCWYQDYNKDTRAENFIAGGNDDWREFRTAEENKIDSVYYGYLSEYDGSGFVQYYDHNLFRSENFNARYLQATKNGWVDNSTRALMVTQNFYHPSTDYWLVFLAVFECSTSGLVYPSKLNIVALTPNIYDRSSGANTADIFRIIFALYIIYIYVMTVLELRVGKRNIKHAVSFQGLMDLLLVFMIIVSVIMATNINKNEEEIYLKQSYTDLYDIVQLYKQYQNINSTTLILVLIRIIVFMSVNKRIYTLTVMVQHASRNMISFLIILISVLSALALIAESIWGTYIYMYRTYTYSFLSLLLLYIGHGDYKVMFDGDLSWSVVFFLVYFFCIAYFLLAAFMGIYTDAYKMVRLLEGYLDDKITWTRKDLVLYLVDWLPNIAKRLLMELIYHDSKKKKAVEEEEEEEEEVE